MTKPVKVTSRTVKDSGKPPLKGASVRTREIMAAINVRMPREMFDWLNDQATENGTTVSDEVRNAIATRMMDGLPIKHVGGMDED